MKSPSPRVDVAFARVARAHGAVALRGAARMSTCEDAADKRARIEGDNG